MKTGRFALIVLIAFALCGCSNLSGTSAQQMAAWANAASYSSSNALLNDDLEHIRAGIALKDLKGVRTECAGFGVDAATLQGELPTPNNQVTDELDSALSSFYNASLDCYGASSFSGKAFKRAQSEIKSGEAVYAEARKLLAEDGVR